MPLAVYGCTLKRAPRLTASIFHTTCTVTELTLAADGVLARAENPP
jgi:hypothetical protein